MSNPIQEDEGLRDAITSIMYGANWKKQPIANAFKPDVEAAMKLIKQYGLDSRIDELKSIEAPMGKWHYIKIRLLELTALKNKQEGK